MTLRNDDNDDNSKKSQMNNDNYDTNHKTKGGGEGYFLNSSLPLLLTPQTLRDYLGDYYILHSS